jgi:hypothetical protein
MALIPCWRRRIAARMDDCIVVLGCTYIGGGGPPRGSTQEAPEGGGGAPGRAPQTLTLQGARKPQIQESMHAQHGSCIQAAKYNSNKKIY